MDLFEYTRKGVLEKEAPLASRMRPRTLDEDVGQEHIIGDDKLLSRAIRDQKGPGGQRQGSREDGRRCG